MLQALQRCVSPACVALVRARPARGSWAVPARLRAAAPRAQDAALAALLLQVLLPLLLSAESLLLCFLTGGATLCVCYSRSPSPQGTSVQLRLSMRRPEALEDGSVLDVFYVEETKIPSYKPQCLRYRRSLQDSWEQVCLAF